MLRRTGLSPKTEKDASQSEEEVAFEDEGLSLSLSLSHHVKVDVWPSISQTQHHNIFRTRCIVKKRVSNVSIDMAAVRI